MTKRWGYDETVSGRCGACGAWGASARGTVSLGAPPAASTEVQICGIPKPSASEVALTP